MKRWCLIFYLLIQIGMPEWSRGQPNLVPNPSFEQYNRCPFDIGQIVYPVSGGNPYPTVTEWSNPVNSSTPDYFNACSGIATTINVPHNQMGRRTARTGNAYAGFFVVMERAGIPYREYITARLSQPLQAGHTYYTSFYVSRGAMDTRNGSAIWNSNDNTATTDDIGAYISHRRVDEPQYIPLSYTPQIRNPAGNYIDTPWTRVDGLITAGGGEQWITIGNFNPLHNYVLRDIRNTSGNFPSGYFFVDDVCLMDITGNFQSHELQMCQGNDSMVLQTGRTGASYRWNTGDTTNPLIVRDTGLYWVETRGECVLYTDTFRVLRTSIPKPFIGDDTLYCYGTEVTLSSDKQYPTYLWNTGETGRTIRVTVPGAYILTAADSCNTNADTVIIGFYPELAAPLVPDTLLCKDEPVQQWYFDTAGLVWYDDAYGPVLNEVPVPNTEETGSITYWISRKEGNCESERDSFILTILAPPDAFSMQDTLICEGTLLVLSAPGEGMKYEWNTGADICCIEVNSPGDYQVKVSNECGSTTAESQVNMVYCTDCVWLPSAFTPTGDGVNDQFRAQVRCPLSNFSLRIFNRWGQVVFESHDPRLGWDGSHTGVPAPVGVYYYSAGYQLDIPGTETQKSLKGEVTLIR